MGYIGQDSDSAPSAPMAPMDMAEVQAMSMESKATMQVDRKRRANIFVRMMARRPCLVFCLSLLFAVSISVLGLVLGEFKVSADNDGWNSRGTFVADKQAQDSARQNLWARMRGREQEYRRRNLLSSDAMNLPDGGGHGNDFLALFHAKDDDQNLLRMEPLKEICEYEQKVFKLTEDAHICRTGYDQQNAGECFHPVSFVTLVREYVFNQKLPYSPKTWMTCDQVFSQINQVDLDVLARAYVHEAKTGQGFVPGQPPLIPEMYFGGIVGTDMVNGGKNQTALLRSVFSLDHEEHVIDRMYEYHTAGSLSLKSALFSLAYDVGDGELVDKYVDEVLTEDMIMAVAATGIILFLIWFHTRSVFMAFIGVIQVALSFPSAYFAYKLLIGLQFFPFLNFLAMFVVMGIGADDIFVLFDKFEQAAQKMPHDAPVFDLACEAIPSASYAMLLTSLTTAGAFFSTAVTPVAPIRMFAIFLGLMTVFDYIFVILICAPAMVMQLYWVRGIHAKGPHAGRYLKLNLLDFSQYACRRSKEAKKDTITQVVLVAFAKAMAYLRYILVPGLIAVFAYFTTVALDIPMPKSSEVQLFPDNNQFTKYNNWKNDLYEKHGAETSWVRVIWGLRPGDTGNLNDPTSKSNVILDSSFDMTQPSAQTWMLEFCEEVVKQDFATGTADCTIRDFDDWLRNLNTQQGFLSLPLPADDFTKYLVQWRSYREGRQRDVGLMSEVLADREANDGEYHTTPYDPNTAASEDIAYFVMAFEATVKWNDPYHKLKSQYYAWSSFIEGEKAKAPGGINAFFFISDDFHWWDTNRQMKNSAYLSALLSVAVATAVIFVSNGNVLLTLYSVVSIFCILVTVAATAVALGWELGFLEAICFAILVGLACDFIVHIAHAYKESDKGTRRDKCMDAVWTMGPPVMYAALSTSLAGSLLFNCTILFYMKFGAILLFTMAYSFLMIFVFLVPLLCIVGPTGQWGNVYALFGASEEN